MSKKVSVIIPTLNEEKHLPKLLKDLQKQKNKDFEVVIVDAYSDDKTCDKAHEFDDGMDIRVITLPEGFKDPDDCVTKDPKIWKKAIAEATDAMTYYFKKVFGKWHKHIIIFSLAIKYPIKRKKSCSNNYYCNNPTHFLCL